MFSDLALNAFVFIALMFWGAWGIFDKKALSLTTPIGQLAAVFAYSPLIAVIVVAVLSTATPGWHLSGSTLLYCALGSVASLAALSGYLMAMSRGEASFILGVTAGYPVVAQLMAHFLLGEPLVPARLAGCCVLVVGIALISGFSKPARTIYKDGISEDEKSDFLIEPHAMAKEPALVGADVRADSAGTHRLSRLRSLQDGPPSPVLPNLQRSSEKLAMLVTICGITIAIVGWAVRCIFDKLAVDGAAPGEVFLGKYICDSLLLLLIPLWFLGKKAELKLPSPKSWMLAAGSAVCLAGGNAAYFAAMSKASASYVITITGCYPLVMYVLAVFILKEQFNLPRAIGIALVTLGGILTQTTQGC